VRLGDKVLFSGSDPGLLLPLASKVGLSGQTLVISAQAEALRIRAEREGVLVETAGTAPANGAFDLAVVQAEGTWTEGLAGLVGAVRRGGRIVVVVGRQARGLLSRFTSDEQHEAAPILMELVSAGWTRGRHIGQRDGLCFVEAVRG
jgi:hypothetical protein